MPVAAPLIGAAAGIGGSLLAGGAAKSAANKAAEAQTQAAQIAADEQRRQFDLTRSDNAPWLAAGQQALGGQLGLLGLNGADAQQGAITALQGSPLYQSLDRIGTEGLLQNASATGGLRGGNTESSLYNNRSDLLAKIIQQQFANLGGISGTGNQTAGLLGQLGQNNAQAIGQLQVGAGNAQAGNYLAAGNANANTFNQLGASLGGLGGLLGSSGIFGGSGGASINGVNGAQFGASLPGIINGYGGGTFDLNGRQVTF